MIKNLFKLIVISFFLTLASTALALRFNDHTSYTDPDYIGYKPSKIIFLTQGASSSITTEIDKRMMKYFKKTNVQVIPYREIFPPTRRWSNEEMTKRLASQHIDSAIIINAGISSRDIIKYSTQTHSNTYLSGTVNQFGNFNANANTNSTTYNNYGAKSKAEFSVVLIDLKSNKIAWYADIATKAGGTLFVGDKGDAKAVSKTIAKALEKDGHISKK